LINTIEYKKLDSKFAKNKDIRQHNPFVDYENIMNLAIEKGHIRIIKELINYQRITFTYKFNSFIEKSIIENKPKIVEYFIQITQSQRYKLDLSFDDNYLLIRSYERNFHAITKLLSDVPAVLDLLMKQGRFYHQVQESLSEYNRCQRINKILEDF
jgi:hypothetical protein